MSDNFVCKYPYWYDIGLGMNCILLKGDVVTIIGVSNDSVYASASNQKYTYQGEEHEVGDVTLEISIATFKEFFEGDSDVHEGLAREY